MADLDAAFAELMKREGGWSEDARDPGGRTRFGISSKAHPEIVLEHLTLETAKDFYRDNYWRPSGAYLIADQELAEELFKAAVNMGRLRAVGLFQNAVGMLISPQNKIVSDGRFGPNTTMWVSTLEWLGHATLLRRTFELEVIKYYAGLKNFNVFGRGWVHRVVGA